MGYLSSTPFAARPLFGDRWPEFGKQALALLQQHDQGDGLVETAQFTVVLGRR
ncbi:hypothetical protein [Streptomyces mobaraensis]|uniref:hypothetical protein n=1 Tax=Streptomyces mobaraensis TaxID=35621 RepID=UPI001F037B74|nr:hypothetical protein [Streptomyces mobaraensis]